MGRKKKSIGKRRIIQVRLLFIMHKVLLLKFQYNIEKSFFNQNPIHVYKMTNMICTLVRELLLFLNVG